jgi:hypothetical protein
MSTKVVYNSLNHPQKKKFAYEEMLMALEVVLSHLAAFACFSGTTVQAAAGIFFG